MKRDFSEAARQELLSLVTQVEDEKWCDFTDWVGDRWYDFEGWIGKLDVRDYISNVNEYHKKVIDKNNTTASDINTIFENVNNVSEQYKSRFVSLLADLQEFKRIIDLLAAFVTPNNGNFNAQFIGSGLKNAINTYLETSDNLQIIAKDGLTQEDVENMDESKLQKILDTYAAVILDNIPDAKIGDEIEIPIGPGVSVYYKVSGKINGTGDIDLNYIVQEQKAQLKDYDYTYDFGGGISASIDNEGNLSVETSGENIPTTTISGTGMSVSYENKIGANTYSYNFELDVFKQEFTMEEKVTTDLEVGSVSSTVGIKYSNDSSWKPLPAPVPVESPYTCQIPDFDIDWETVGNVVVIAGITYAVVKTVAAIALIPATGGTSTVLLVV